MSFKTFPRVWHDLWGTYIKVSCFEGSLNHGKSGANAAKTPSKLRFLD
jgi:hypothetical protein